MPEGGFGRQDSSVIDEGSRHWGGGSGHVTDLSSQEIERATDAQGALVEDVSVDHGGADVLVAQEFLDGPDVLARFEQVRGEAVAIMPSSA
jgi:hypothetical protein